MKEEEASDDRVIFFIFHQLQLPPLPPSPRILCILPLYFARGGSFIFICYLSLTLLSTHETSTIVFFFTILKSPQDSAPFFGTFLEDVPISPLLYLVEKR